jgi:hypothetical protein
MDRRTVLAALLPAIAGCTGADEEAEGPETDDPQPGSGSGSDLDSNGDVTDPADPEPRVDIGSVTVGRHADGDGGVEAAEELERDERLGVSVTYRFSDVDGSLEIELALRTDGETIAETDEPRSPTGDEGDDQVTLAVPTDGLDSGTYDVRVTVAAGVATDTATATVDLV